ncbi:MAG: SRPBCC domain-containing protein, partial [Pseudolabrys sp.]
MSKPVFVYVTYIASTPEKVFKALTDTDATAKFWFGNAVTSDWKVGSPVTFYREGKLIVSGKVLEHDAPRRLSYT